MLLMHVDEALKFEDATIHEAAGFALKNMLAAQYSNGAWPQQFSQPPNSTRSEGLPETARHGSWPPETAAPHDRSGEYG